MSIQRTPKSNSELNFYIHFVSNNRQKRNNQSKLRHTQITQIKTQNIIPYQFPNRSSSIVPLSDTIFSKPFTVKLINKPPIYLQKTQLPKARKSLPQNFTQLTPINKNNYFNNTQKYVFKFSFPSELPNLDHFKENIKSNPIKRLINNCQGPKNRLLVLDTYNLTGVPQSFLPTQNLLSIQSFEYNIKKLLKTVQGKNVILVVLLVTFSLSSGWINYFKSLGVDVWEVQKAGQFFWNASAIEQSYREVESKWWISAFNRQIRCKQEKMCLQDGKDVMRNCFPLCQKNNWQMFFLQHNIYLNKQNINLEIINKMVRIDDRCKLYKIHNLTKCLKASLLYINKKEQKKELLKACKKIKIQNKEKIQETESKTQFMQYKIYNEFKCQAQNQQLNAFFGYVGEWFLRNGTTNISYHNKDFNLLNKLHQFTKNNSIYCDIQNEYEYIQEIRKNIFHVLEIVNDPLD